MPGLLELLVLVALGLVTARSVRHRWLPAGAGGARAWSADALGLIAVLVLAGQLTGAVGLLRLPVLIAVVAVAALGTHRAWGQPPRAVPRSPGRPLLSDAAVGLMAVAGLAPSLQLLISTMRGGTTDVDSEWYHLPVAAWAAQHHSWWQLFHTSVGDPTAYYPFDVEVLQSLGLLAFGNDLLAPLLCVGAVALAFVSLVAATPPGLPRRLSLALLIALLSVPISSSLVLGTAMTDIDVLALGIAAIAQLLPPDGQAPSPLYGGLAAGLAVGTKSDALGPMVLLIVLGWALVPALRTRSSALTMVGTGVLLSAFWFVRDWVRTGTPLPQVALPGLRHVRFALFDQVQQPVADVLVHPSQWSSQLAPQLSLWLTDLWPVVVLVPLLACAGVLLARERVLTVLGLAGLGSFVLYLVTPTTLGPQIGSGRPLFGLTLRYAEPALLFGIVALGRVRQPAWISTAVIVGCAGVVLLGITDDTSWLPGDRSTAVAASIVCAAAGAWWWLAPQGRVRTSLTAGLATVGVTAVALSAVSLHDHDQRQIPGATGASIFSWAQDVHHARIGVVGSPLTYGFTGRGLTNTVVYVGHDDAGVLQPLTSCRAFAEQLTALHLDFLVVDPTDQYPDYVSYAHVLAGATIVATAPIPKRTNDAPTFRVTVLRLPAVISSERCHS